MISPNIIPWERTVDRLCVCNLSLFCKVVKPQEAPQANLKLSETQRPIFSRSTCIVVLQKGKTLQIGPLPIIHIGLQTIFSYPSSWLCIIQEVLLLLLLLTEIFTTILWQMKRRASTKSADNPFMLATTSSITLRCGGRLMFLKGKQMLRLRDICLLTIVLPDR